MTKKKGPKPVEEMNDRELAEHLLGKETIARAHEDFDLRDTSKKDGDDFTPTR